MGMSVNKVESYESRRKRRQVNYWRVMLTVWIVYFILCCIWGTTFGIICGGFWIIGSIFFIWLNDGLHIHNWFKKES